MQQNILYALVVVGAISAGTIGFANTLTVGASAINPIGGEDGVISSPGSTITKFSWTEANAVLGDGDIEISEALVTIDNQSGFPHTYEACVVISDGSAVESIIGCQQTVAQIPNTANEIVSVTFGTPFDTIVATNFYISLEELD